MLDSTSYVTFKNESLDIKETANTENEVATTIRKNITMPLLTFSIDLGTVLKSMICLVYKSSLVLVEADYEEPELLLL